MFFLWLEGHDHSHVKIFQINSSDRFVQSHASLCFSKVGHKWIWILGLKASNRKHCPRSAVTVSSPPQMGAFCVIYKDRKHFLAQSSSSQRHTATGHLKPPLPLSPVLTNEIVAGLVYHNNTLLCLELHKKHLRRQYEISSYSINPIQRDGRSLASIDTARQILGKLDDHIDASAGIAIGNSEGQVELLVYASGNKIFRYSQSR